MFFKSAFVSALLLASAALANGHRTFRRFPSISSHIEQRDGHLHKNSPAAAGAVVLGKEIHSVSSTFTLPKLTGSKTDSLLVTMNLGANKCNNTLTFASLIGPNSYEAAVLLSADEKDIKFFDQDRVHFNGGDEIKVILTATSATDANATVINTSRKKAHQMLTLKSASLHICTAEASFVIGYGDKSDSLLNFGTFAFENPEIGTSSGTLTVAKAPPHDVVLIDLTSKDGKKDIVKTSVSPDGAVVLKE